MKKVIFLIIFAAVIAGVYYSFFNNGSIRFENSNSINKDGDEGTKIKMSDEEIHKLILTHLPDHLLDSDKGKVFCSTKLYGSDYSKNDHIINIYIWAYCEEYFLVETDIEKGTSYNNPAIVKIESSENDVYKISEVVKIADNEDSVEWVKSNFSDGSQELVDFENDHLILSPTPERQAQNYFKGILEAYF